MGLPSIEDYMAALQNPALLKAKELQGGRCEKQGNIVIRYAGGFCVVFKFNVNGKTMALRCWRTDISNIKERTRIIASYLESVRLPYFIGFKYIDNAIVTAKGTQPVVLMDWVSAQPLKGYMSRCLMNNDCEAIRCLANNFKNMVQSLHKHKISHGDLQHGNILVKDDGSIILVDYDSMYVPDLDGYVDEIKGLDGYQHKARNGIKEVSPIVDYFSELVIYISLVAISENPELWHKYNIEDTETLLFTKEDLIFPEASSVFMTLHNMSEEISRLADVLIDFIGREKLEELDPLEDVIVPRNVEIVEHITEKINLKPKAASPDYRDIIEKMDFSSPKPFHTESPTDGIASKF